jgi:hypothetical protein
LVRIVNGSPVYRRLTDWFGTLDPARLQGYPAWVGDADRSGFTPAREESGGRGVEVFKVGVHGTTPSWLGLGRRPAVKAGIQLSLSLSLALVAAGLFAPPVKAFALEADVWVNLDGFSYTCLGVHDNYPSSLYSQARTGLTNLGYTLGVSVIGHGFTRSAFLSKVGPPFALYVHSHGDVYKSTSIRAAFLQDPPSGYCNDYTRDYISAAQIQANRVLPYTLVIIAACYLGSMYQPHKGTAYPNMMPEAFGIAKNQTQTNNAFYLGYVYSTYDSAVYSFEGRFFTWLKNHPGAHLMDGRDYAQGIGDYDYVDDDNPFLTAWYGDPNTIAP